MRRAERLRKEQESDKTICARTVDLSSAQKVSEQKKDSFLLLIGIHLGLNWWKGQHWGR